MKYHKYAAFLFYTVVTFVPNIKFYVVKDQYIINYPIYVTLFYVLSLLLGMFYELSKDKMRSKVYTNQKVIFIILLASSLLTSFVFYKVLFVKSW